MNRIDVADTAVLYYKYRNGREPSKAVRDLSAIGCYKSSGGRYSTSEIDALEDAEPEVMARYLAWVARDEGPAAAAQIADDMARIADPKGVTIYVTNRDDDPTVVAFHIQDPLATAWCDRHGALMGGTWECADGSDFWYDSGVWYPGCFDELREYKLNFAEYGEPDDRDLAIMAHASECDACGYDYHKAEEHTGL